ncbi:MAG TPA: 5-formyltetrahydrofolate cyclo-ligase [Bacteroidales bacterium]|nr:5-formyltetrahydrofolate cyclo-ligase [Bacteroidales bacterium]
MTEKAIIREQVQSRRKIFSPAELCQKSFQICHQIEQHERFLSSECVMMYYPLPGEVDLTTLLDNYYRAKTLLLPVVSGKNIVLKQYTGRHNLVQGAFGILEPTGDIWSKPTTPGLIIVPGLAFDHQGHRLGRGQGFYDRFLLHQKGYKIGVCFHYQIFPSIPVETHDISVDEVIFA